MNSNKSRFFKFISRFLDAKKAATAPAFLVAAGLVGFVAAPAQAASTTETITESKDSGEFTADNLVIGKGEIIFGGNASANISSSTKIQTGTNLIISSSSETLNFGNVSFEAPIDSDSITIADGVSVNFVSVAAANNYGKINVNTGANLEIAGTATLSVLDASGKVSIGGTATVQNLVARTGAEVSLNAETSGVNKLSMAGGTVNVKNFALDKISGDGEELASGKISASGALTIGAGATLTAGNLNLETVVVGDGEDAQKGSIVLREGSNIDLGSGTITLADGTSLTIGDADTTSTASETLKAASLTAGAGATTTLNGGMLELTGVEISQSLDSLVATSTGTVSVSGENATAKFSTAKTFTGALNLEAKNGTLEIADGIAVSTAGKVSAKNLTIGNGEASIKAKEFTFGEDGTLKMSGGKLDLSDTDNKTTNIYGIAQGSSGEITLGETSGAVVLNKSANAGELKFSAEKGTLKLADGEDAISVSTTGDVNAKNLDIGANTLSAGAVEIAKSNDDNDATGLTLNGGTLLGTSVKINAIADNISGKIAAKADGTVEIDLSGDPVKTTGTLTLGDENTQTIKILGNGLTLGENSSVIATGTEPGTSGLIVGVDNDDSATIFDLSAEGTTLNVNAVAVYCNDQLKLSGNQTIGSGATLGKITLGAAATGDNNAAGIITTTGTLKSLGQTTMNGGKIESTGTDDTENGFLAIELGNTSMGNGNVYAQNGTAKLGDVSDQGTIAAKNVIIGSISDSAQNTVKIAQSKGDKSATASDSLTFSGTTASNISANANSSVNTKKLVLANGATVTIGSDTNKAILTEESLEDVELGEKATLTTTTADALTLSSISLDKGAADKATSWTHNGSNITVGTTENAGTVDLDNNSSLTVAGGNIDFTKATLTTGDLAIVKTTVEDDDTTNGDIKLGVVKPGAGELPTASIDAAKNIEFHEDATVSLRLDAKEIIVKSGKTVEIVNGYVNKQSAGENGRAEKITIESDATFALLGNNAKLNPDTPGDFAHILKDVSLGNGATLIVGGDNPFDTNEPKEIYVTSAIAKTIENSEESVGTIVVDGNGVNKAGDAIHSTLTAETVGGNETGSVNVTLNRGGELIATGADDNGVAIYVAALNGNGGALTAKGAGGKKDIYITASNELGDGIAITADELRITNLEEGSETNVEVKLSNLDLSNVDSLVVAGAKTTSLVVSNTVSDWGEIKVSVGENETGNGTLKITENSEIKIGELAVEKKSVLEIADSELIVGKMTPQGEAPRQTANFDGTLSLDNGTLTITSGGVMFMNGLAEDSTGKIEVQGDGGAYMDFTNGIGKDVGALTLETNGGTLGIWGNSTFADGSEINTGSIIVGAGDAEGDDGSETNITVDATKADINELENVYALEGGILKTAEDFTADGKGALKQVSAIAGTFENDGDLEIGTLTIAGGENGKLTATGDVRIDKITGNFESTEDPISGTISGANVSIGLDSLTPDFTGSLTINAGENDGGTITLDGNTGDDEFVADAVLNASTLVIGSDKENEVTNVKISDNATLDDFANLEIKSGDKLHIVEAEDGSAWERGNDLTITNSGTLAVDGDFTVVEDVTFTIAGGKSEFSGTVTNNGAFVLEDGAMVKVATWEDSADSMLSLSGTADGNLASLIITDEDGKGTTIDGTISADNAVLRVSNGDLEIAGGAGDIDNLLISAGGEEATIKFTTENGFETGGRVGVVADNVSIETDVSLGAGSGVLADKLEIADGKTGTIFGKIEVEDLAGTLVLDGTGSNAFEKDSTFSNLADVASSTLTVQNGASLTQNDVEEGSEESASLELNGKLNVIGVPKDKAQFSAAGGMTVNSSISLEDYGVLNVKNGILKLADGATLSLKNGAIANLDVLDLTESKTGAVLVDGDNNPDDLTIIYVNGELTLADGISDDTKGTIQLKNGGKFVTDKITGEYKITGVDGSGNIWVDANSQFRLTKGAIDITTETHGEIISDDSNVVFKENGNYELAGIGTRNLELGDNMSVEFDIVENFDQASGEYSYSHVNVRNDTEIKNASLTITDIKRANMDGENGTLGDFCNASFDNAKLTVVGNSENETLVKLEASKGLNLTNNTTATISDIELVGGSNMKVGSGSTFTATDSVISGFESIAIAETAEVSLKNSELKVNSATVAGTLNVSGADVKLGETTVSGDMAVENSKVVGNLAFAEDASGAEISITNSTVDGNVSLTGDNTLSLEDAKITGDLTATSGTLNIAGTNTAGTIDVRDAFVNQVSGSSLTATTLFAKGYTLEENATIGTNVKIGVGGAQLAGTVAGNLTLKDSNVVMSNITETGSVSGTLTLDNSNMTVAGTVAGKTTLAGESSLTQTAGTLADVAVGADANFTQEDGVAGAISATGGKLDLAGAVASIDAKNSDVKISGTVSGNVSLSGGTLELASALSGKSSQISAKTTVATTGALTLDVDTDAVRDLSVSGTATLNSAGDFSLSLAGGNGTVNKNGDSALALGSAANFSGTLNIADGNASLENGARFGGNVNFDSGKTFAAGNGSAIAQTLTLAAGSTLEIGDRKSAATFSVGKIAESAATRTASALRALNGTKIVHDIYSADDFDVLKVTGSGTDLSFATAVVRSNVVDETALGIDGITLDLIEGTVASGYGAVEGDGFRYTNFALTEDGKSVCASLNYKAAARGFGSVFNANQRAVAFALPKRATGRLGEYTAVLIDGNKVKSTAETARALDALGATHLVSMIPAQIAGTWNHVRNVSNAIGQSLIVGGNGHNYGVWAQYVTSNNDVDATFDRQDWKRTMNGGMAGIEYSLSREVIAGIALGYEDSELKSNGNKTDDSAYHVDLYLRQKSESFTQNAIFSLAQHNYDIDRSVNVGGLHDSMSGSTDGFSFAASYEASYEIEVNKYIALHPLVNASVAFNKIDGWSESGDVGLSFSRSDAWTLLAGAGVRAEFLLPFSYDLDLATRLSVHAIVQGEFGDRSDELTANFAGANNYTLDYDDSNACMLDLGASLLVPVSEKVSIFGGISTKFRSDESSFNANLGVRIGW